MDDYADAAHAAVELLAEHVAEARAGLGPVNMRPDPDELADELELSRWIAEGGMDRAALEQWLPRYLDATVRLHHPGSMAHQVAVPSTGAAVADLIHGATNNPMAIYEMGAAGATIEREVVCWMLDKAGFGADAGGVLTSGGSLANLTALLAARARVAPEAWRAGTPADLALLAPPSAHYSVRRAAAILGLGEDAVLELEVDELERIRPDRLEDALERCAAAGRRPLALVALACATSTGLYDDLREIGSFCREHGIWLHVDAAHGASALLSERHRGLLDGIELGDSVVWDAHKLLRTSGLCAAVLTRREADLRAAFRQSGDYLFNDNDSVGFDLLDRALETTKTTMGLKLFLSLAWTGERGLGDYVASRFDTARRFHELLSREPDVTCAYVPESNILCFRIGDGDQLVLRNRALDGGRLHFGSTTVNGERNLRLVVTAPDTGDETLHELLHVLRALREPELVRAGSLAPLGADDGLPTIFFASAGEFESWLEENHETADGVWIKMAKKATGIESVRHDEAVDVALCFGWIDGRREGLDEAHFMQRFTPRRPRSRWSRINRDKVERMAAEGRMRPAGLVEVERAKADGRWDAAYEGQSASKVPDDLQRELEARPRAKEFFEGLNSQNRYAIIYRLGDAKRPETRARRLEKFVAMLERGEKLR